MKKILSFIIIFSVIILFGQNSGSVNTVFGPPPGFNGIVNSVVHQNDGSIIIGEASILIKEKYKIELLV